MYGNKLNPERQFRTPRGIKGLRQNVVVTNNPSQIDQNQILNVRFPNLGSNDVIVPGSVRLAFNITLNTSKDATTKDPKDLNRTLVKNVGRAIVKKLVVKFEGNEVLCIDDYDTLMCYYDLWKTEAERRNAVYQGIVTEKGQTENCLKIRIDAGDKNVTISKDKILADTYKNRFFIPLDFELLETCMPFHQAGLGERLAYEITFNDYGRVIRFK